MIRKKNVGQEFLTLKIVGGSTASQSSTNKDVAVVPFDGFISNISGLCTTITGNTNTILDVNKNGTTVFSASTKVTFSTGSVTASISDLTSNPTSVSAGDLITLDADTFSTTITNPIVTICISKTQPGLMTTLSDQNIVL